MTLTRRSLFASAAALLALRKVPVPVVPTMALSPTSDHVIVHASEYGRTLEIPVELMEVAREMGRATRDNADARALAILEEMRRDWVSGRT